MYRTSFFITLNSSFARRTNLENKPTQLVNNGNETYFENHFIFENRKTGTITLTFQCMNYTPIPFNIKYFFLQLTIMYFLEN